jgi:hypothetical protein
LKEGGLLLASVTVTYRVAEADFCGLPPSIAINYVNRRKKKMN